MTKLVKTTGATTFADSNFCLREACACCCLKRVCSTKGQLSSRVWFDSFQNFFVFCVLKNPTKRCYLIEKKRKAFLLPRSSSEKRRLAEEEERDIQRPRSTRTQTRRYLRAFARSNAPTARVWTFLSSSPPSYDSTRDCARHILSLRFPDTGQKRKQRERVIPSARKKKGKRAFEIPRRTGCATLFACVFLLTDATETHLFVIWAIADIIIVCVCVWWYALSVRACGM